MFKFGANKDKKENKSVKQIKNWYQDRYEAVLIQRNFFVLLLTFLIIVFGVSILWFIELNKQKVYEPYVIQVEEQTGVITRVDSRTVKNMSAEEAIRNSILVRYITARENYSASDYAYNYNQVVRVISAPDVFNQFMSVVSADNPASPIHFENTFRVDTKIKTIVDLTSSSSGPAGKPSGNVIQIRVTKQKIALFKNAVMEEKNFIITLNYEYKDVDLSENARYINPLGLQVTAYLISEEIDAKNI